MAADAVSAVANAIGDIANTVSSFVAKAAQEYGLKKGMEVGTVQFEQSKTLVAYNGVLADRKNTMIFLIIAFVLVVAVIILKNK